MALYLGNKIFKIILNNTIYNLIVSSSITNGINLLSSDNYILKDINGILLTAKESE